METSFKGKKALVTGAARGIGKDIVKALVNHGATVYAVSKTEELLKQLAAELPGVIPIQVDLSDWQATGKALENIEPVDYLVNNAGVALMAPFGEITEDHFNTIFDVNVKAIVNVSQTVVKKMIEAGIQGSIVNISSVSAQRTAKGLSTYCASKSSVDMYTKTMANELGAHKIRVNSVNPTIVWTDMGKDLWTDPSQTEKILERIPLGRFATTDEVVHATLFFLSDKTSMTTGETFLIDGGFCAR